MSLPAAVRTMLARCSLLGARHRVTFAIAFGVALLALAVAFGAAPAAQAPINLTGTWKGTGHDTFVGGQPDTIRVTWVVTQTGSTVSGTVETLPFDTSDGSCSSCHRVKTGTFSGTISGTALTLTMDFPEPSGGPTPACAVTITGFAATIANDAFTTAYSGTDSCEVPILNGTLEMTRQVTAPVITTQPESQTVASGANATFTVAATDAPAYRWQVSANGGASFTDLSDALPYSDVTSATLTVTGASAGLSGYQYRAVANNSAGSATSSAATLTVTAPPAMSIDKTSLTFSATTTGAAFSSKTGTQTVRLTQTGDGTVGWTVVSIAPWLVVSPTSGSGSATLNLSVQFAPGLASTQSDNVTLTFTGAGNTAGPIVVTLNTVTSTADTPPQGSFDTPANGSTGVTGSVPVTGWAIDDKEVTRVRILRNPVAGEPAGQLVFIGDAVQVEGARPDVQAMFPTVPRASRAGWGYLLLTNVLPGLGNGTFTLTAIADDADGHSTTLGTKTITCANSSATTPTGALDTPAPGASVSGNVTNFGWVLAPSPYRADPPGGGTVRVVVDGTVIGAVPSGWTSRSDLTALFPAAQYPGIGHALGVAVFDSTQYANGVHTISWLVTDNLGSASGIGSRYFTVSNGSLDLDPAQGTVTGTGSRVIAGSTSPTIPFDAALRIDSAAALAAAVDQAPGAFTAIRGRRGSNLDAPLEAYAVDGGRVTVRAEELDRIELHLKGVESAVTGYLRVAGALAPLPIGSALNAQTGVFTWGPGVGFVGTYDLVFVQWSHGQAVARQDVRIVLNPKGSSRVGPQTVIDLPGRTAVVGPSFVLAGWAADLDSAIDRGVDAVHVWAYPVTPSTRSLRRNSGQPGQAADPIWIGAAVYGGARPDVAAIYGERFFNTGYGLSVQGLAPGTYDLAVFAYSTVRSAFVPATTVRVTVR
jgi:hypothetical protein